MNSLTTQSDVGQRTRRVAVLGAGTMGSALLDRAVARGWLTENIVATARTELTRHHVATAHGVSVEASNAVAVTKADLVVICVKPAQLGEVLADIAGHLRADTVVVSIVVGVTTESLESYLPYGTAVIRAMPNIAAVVGRSITVTSAGKSCTDDQVVLAHSFLATSGAVVPLPESQHSVAAIVASAAPAIYFSILDAVGEGAVSLGLPRSIAIEISVGSLAGAIELARETGEHPVVLRERVCSPGGASIAGLLELDKMGARSAVVSAVRASYARAEEIGKACSENCANSD